MNDVIDACQYCNWSEKIFAEMRAGKVSVVQATVAYQENFRETIANLVDWNWRFQQFDHLILHAAADCDIERAAATNRTAVILGLQTPAPIENDIGLIEVLRRLGVLFMQLSYNTQSLLCGGWAEADGGLTQMGREAIREMNRVGMIVDMSHSGERSTLEAIELSEEPIVVSHANPSWWRPTNRNKSDAVLRALAETGGMIGLSVYPAHLAHGSRTTLEEFAAMAARVADLIGVEHIGLGTDLCQDQPHRILTWMREGRWMRPTKAGQELEWPEQPAWFRSNLDFDNLRGGLRTAGFSAEEAAAIMSGNWRKFLKRSLSEAQTSDPDPAAPDARPPLAEGTVHA